MGQACSDLWLCFLASDQSSAGTVLHIPYTLNLHYNYINSSSANAIIFCKRTLICTVYIFSRFLKLKFDSGLHKGTQKVMHITLKVIMNLFFRTLLTIDFELWAFY